MHIHTYCTGNWWHGHDCDVRALKWRDCSEFIASDKILALDCYQNNWKDIVTIATDENTVQAFMWYKTVVVVKQHTLFNFPFLPSLFLPSFPFLPSSLPTSSFHLSPHPFLPPSLQPLSIPLSSLPSPSTGLPWETFTTIHCLCKLSCSHQQPLIPGIQSVLHQDMVDVGNLVCMHSPHLLHLFILLLSSTLSSPYTPSHSPLTLPTLTLTPHAYSSLTSHPHTPHTHSSHSSHRHWEYVLSDGVGIGWQTKETSPPPHTLTPSHSHSKAGVDVVSHLYYNSPLLCVWDIYMRHRQ